MKTYIVYCHTNLMNGKKYIGITCQDIRDRWRLNGTGYKNQKKFYNAIEKYGWDAFAHEILYTNLTEEQAKIIEQSLIEKYDAIKNGYNVLKGGNVTHHSSETISKIRESHIGHKPSKDTIQKMKTTKMKKYGNQVLCIETGIIYPSMGEAMRLTGIDKTSISRCCSGKQGSAGGYHWRYLQENGYIQKTDKRKKKVICLTNNKIYNSVTEAANDTGSDASNIIKVCNGKYKTTNGLKWKWLDEED